jgi:hypothetical protein
MYKQGKTYPLQKKIEVVEKYKSLKELYGNVSAQTLAQETGVTKVYARKIKREVDEEGLACPKRKANQIIGYKVLTHRDETLLLAPRKSNPRRSLHLYRSLLSLYNRTYVSKILIHPGC